MGCATVLPAADYGFERKLQGNEREFAWKIKTDVQDNVEIQDRLRPVSSQNGMRRSIVKYGTILYFKGRTFTFTFRDYNRRCPMTAQVRQLTSLSAKLAKTLSPLRRHILIIPPLLSSPQYRTVITVSPFSYKQIRLS